MMSARTKYTDAVDEEDERRGGLLHLLISFALAPIRPFISRSARRTYLAAFLFTSAALLLLVPATIGYVFFYYSYVPRIGFERTIHLQFDNVFSHAGADPTSSIARVSHPYPYGTVALSPDMIGAQPYDVNIELAMPRTPDNTNAGNFMLEVNMYATGGGVGTPLRNAGNVMEAVRADTSPTSTAGSAAAPLASSRRSAILPYRSWIVDLLYRATELHWYLLGVRSEATTLTIPVYEKVSFRKGRANIPATLRLEIQSIHRIQIYSAKVSFRARFVGLRWLMYNHRIISAILFIGGFWATELISAGIAWAALAMYLTQSKAVGSAEKVDEIADGVKKEEEEEDLKPGFLSDTERTFPTLSHQQPLHYTSHPEAGSSGAVAIKREDDDAPLLIPDAVARAAEADDEDEDEDVDFFDSGIGTSLDSSGPAKRDSVRRRRARME